MSNKQLFVRVPFRVFDAQAEIVGDIYEGSVGFEEENPQYERVFAVRVTDAVPHSMIKVTTYVSARKLNYWHRFKRNAASRGVSVSLADIASLTFLALGLNRHYDVNHMMEVLASYVGRGWVGVLSGSTIDTAVWHWRKVLSESGKGRTTQAQIEDPTEDVEVEEPDLDDDFCLQRL